MSGAARKPEGSHKFCGMVVCDRCGHKESWDSGFAAMAAHIREHAGSARKTIPAVPKMTCPNCTARISSASRKCHWCGAALRTAPDAPQTA